MMKKVVYKYNFFYYSRNIPKQTSNTKEDQMSTKPTQEQIQKLAEFLVKYQPEYDGAVKLMPTAINEAKERWECGDFKVRPQNSVDGKEHIFEI